MGIVGAVAPVIVVSFVTVLSIVERMKIQDHELGLGHWAGDFGGIKLFHFSISILKETGE